MEKKSAIDRFTGLFFLFLEFCLVGWIYEVTLAFIYGYGFVNRGFLFGPYLPIYGFAGILLVLSLGGLMKKKVTLGSLPVTPVVVFLLIIVITTVLEYVCSYFLELVFNQRWWDYSHYPYNINGRVCLSASLRFGIGGMIFLYLLAPLFNKLTDKMPMKVRRLVAVVLTVLLLVDLVVTLSSM